MGLSGTLSYASASYISNLYIGAICFLPVFSPFGYDIYNQIVKFLTRYIYLYHGRRRRRTLNLGGCKLSAGMKGR